ncbi:MAG: hypothetical protein IKV61_04510 [Clostridia bacterium]|nr:hypothetical protein [Clostridia bacterium]
MRKIITWILIIIGVMWFFGGCDSCGGCDDCSGGCDLTRGCDSGCSVDSCEKEYKGEITMNIHRNDGSVLVVKGNREYGKKNTIFNNSGDYETFGNYTIPERVGYNFGGLEYTDVNGYSRTLLSNSGYINYENLWKIKDKSTIEVYERWNAIYYRVSYVTSAGQFGSYRQDADYCMGSQIVLDSNIQEVFNSESHPRKTQVGYTAYFENNNGDTVELPWTFDQTFNESHIEYFKNVKYGDKKIFVKANWVSDTVQVKLHFKYKDGNDIDEIEQTLTVGYDEDLTKYFEEYVDAPKRQFFGWYLDEAFEASAPREISASHANTPLVLYAKHLEFKEIYIDLQDGNGPRLARAYEDNETFLIQDSKGAYTIQIPEKSGKLFYGLSLNPQEEERTLYVDIIESGTYYPTYN